jgi:dihydrofolate reductase
MGLEGSMRKVVLKIDVSLDGFVGTSSGEVDWIFPNVDDELRAYRLDQLWQAGVHIMGRQTYEDMAGYWPTSDHPYAAPMNEIPKVVFSKTLRDAAWADSRVATGDTGEEIARLKQQPGKDILAHGGASFVQSLSRLGLIDEYRLFFHPVALGSGLPLFTDAIDLRLVNSRAFATGVLALTYAPA